MTTTKHTQVRTVDMTPTWPEALLMARAVIENGTDEGKALAWTEIERMAAIAQQAVDSDKAADAKASEANKAVSLFEVLVFEETGRTFGATFHDSWTAQRFAGEMRRKGFDAVHSPDFATYTTCEVAEADAERVLTNGVKTQ